MKRQAQEHAVRLKWQRITRNGITVWNPKSSQIGKKESIKDTARVLGRMYDGIEYRGFGQEIVEELAKHAGVPVWNGLTNEYHPTQMLADMLTIRENFGKLEGIKLVYMGDARYNMGNSLMIACAKLGMHFVACTTKEYFPNEELVEILPRLCKRVRCDDHIDRRCESRNERRRRYLHGRMGIHGRAG